MLAIIGPAKKLDMESPLPTAQCSEPLFLDEVKELVGIMKQQSAADIQALMGVSEKIAALNVTRYQEFSFPITKENARPALLAFNGDVFVNIHTKEFKEDDYRYAQSHLRIISGLYGLLRPMDLIEPYRLEMGVKLTNPEGDDLYAYWRKKATDAVNSALAESGSDLLLNLASDEYAKAIDFKAIKGQVVTCYFKEERDGVFKNVGILAKRARGMMVNYFIRQQAKTLDSIKKFDYAGYSFNASLSDNRNYVFTR